MKGKLTIKQENFCNYYVETGNASEAYRRAYSCAKMKDESVNRKAIELLNYGKITARVAELQAEQKAKSDITKEEIIGLCVRVIRGELVTDGVEDRGGRKAARTISKTWAIDRVCRMLGFDAPTKAEISGKEGAQAISIEIIDSREKMENEDPDDEGLQGG